MLGLDLSHLAAGKVKDLLAEQLENDHVVLTKALAGTTRPDDVADECGPVLGPLLLQDLETQGHMHVLALLASTVIYPSERDV